MPKIRYYKRESYGVMRLYPLDYAYELELMTNCKTIREQDTKALTGMGFDLEQVIEPELRTPKAPQTKAERQPIKKCW